MPPPEEAPSAAVGSAGSTAILTVSWAGPLVLWLADGSLSTRAPAASPPVDAMTAEAIVKVASDAAGFVAAAERVGLFRIRLDSAGWTAELGPPLGTGFFAGRSVGSLFTSGNLVLCHLFIDDLRLSNAAGTGGPEPIVVALAEGGPHPVLRSIPAKGTPLTRIFGVFPAARDSWLVQTRTVDDERVLAAWFEYDPIDDSLVPIDRESFESGSIRPESSLPPAAASVSGGPAAIVFWRRPDGSRSVTRTGSGDPGDAVEWYAAGDEESSICVSRNGGGFSAVGTAMKPFRVSLPSGQAVVVDAALSSGAAALAWQEDYFPAVGASGLILLALP
ncbi:MAG: hypothetical protein NT080_02870 [Spirochaetes bacterium]|nr:hypothetical protein [Spirochaetota bacterium]